MANTLRIKRRASGNAGAPTSLENAELAFNEVDNILYYGKGTGGAGGTATTIETIGGLGAFVGLAGTQTITGNKTFSGTVSLGSSATATTPSTSDNSTAVATTAFVKALGLGSGTVTSVGLSLPNIFTVSNSPVTTTGTLTATLASQTANYVFAAPNGSAGSPTFRALVAADIPTLTANKISDFDTQVRTNRLDQMAAPTASVAMNNQLITGLATPVSDSDAATKLYVDNVAQGLHIHATAKCATTSPLYILAGATVTYDVGTQAITWTGGNAVTSTFCDGQALTASTTESSADRILVKNEGNSGGLGAAYNGTYYAYGARELRRTADGNTAAEWAGGDFCYVTAGTTYEATGWVQTEKVTTLNTTPIIWEQFSGAGTYQAGTGLLLTGNVFSTSSSTLTVGADTINLTSGIATAGTYQAVTVDTYGRVTAGTNPTTLSGYGITDALSTSLTSTQNAAFTSIRLYDQGLSNNGSYLIINNKSNHTANRQLDINTGDATRTVTLSGNLTVSSTATLSGTNTGDQTITLTGDVTGSGTGSFTTTLANSGVTGGTYKSVTVNAKGLVTAGTNPTTLSGYGISDAQPLDATLTALAGVTTAANKVIYATGSDTFTTTDLTSFGRSIIDDADASAGRTTLGLGTIATQNANNVSITGGTIDNITLDGGTF